MREQKPMSSLFNVVKKGLHRAGLDVRLTKNIEQAAKREWADKWRAYWRPFVAHRNIKTIIDIGANTGQFATLMHGLLPDARIYSLEPLPDCFEALQKNIAAIPVATAHPFAVGAKSGTSMIQRSAFTPCTSFLKKTRQLDEEFGAGGEVSEVAVEVVTLDDFIEQIDVQDELMIKMDVQGFELEVIKGGLAAFKRAALVSTEVCFFARLYQNQPLFDDIYRALREQGFSYMGNPEQLTGLQDQRVAEADAIFERVVT